MNNRVLTLFLLISGLLLGAMLSRNGDLAWMALPLLAYLGLGMLRSPAADKIQLQAQRTLGKVRTGEISTIEVNVTIRNEGSAIDRLRFFDASQAGMNITDGHTHQLAALQNEGESSLQYKFKAARGGFSWKSVQAVVSDPFGLFETWLELPAIAQIEAEAELNKFRPFPLRSRHTLHSAGSIPARLGGSGTDFWGVREYYPGDSLRRLDWRRMARHPQKFFTKEFEQEEIADIGLILDARHKTDLRVGEDSLFEHSVRATASLAESFLRQGNRVSLMIFRTPVTNVFPGYGKVQLNRILRSLTHVTTETDGSFDSLEFLPTHMFSSHSMILIFSPLSPGDWQLFPLLRAHGYQVLLISPNPVEFARRGLEKDRTTNMAIRLAGIEREVEINKITHLWVPVIDWQVSQPLSPLVRVALRKAHIQQQH